MSQLKKVDHYENINRENILYLIVNKASRYIEEENGNI